tara:strand:- start:9188 stop:9481 length:294 start_codon:yes stop_codon:yes gene_type:complete
MNANEIAIYLLESCNSLKHFDSYMFGSTLHGVGCDIDLLIVGPSGTELSILKQEIDDAGSELPFDVLYMNPSEAIETNFVNREKCIELSILASNALR